MVMCNNIDDPLQSFVGWNKLNTKDYYFYNVQIISQLEINNKVLSWGSGFLLEGRKSIMVEVYVARSDLYSIVYMGFTL